MPLDHQVYSRLRPYLYHLTAHNNLAGIVKDRHLTCAADWLTRAHRSGEVRRKRPSGVEIRADGRTIHLRDQSPLHRGNVQFEGGWDFEDLIEHLNRHVFFWPGTVDEPIVYGRNHYARYHALTPDDLAILRIPYWSLIAANPQSGPGFSNCNSGSPRCSGGKKPVRGPQTFVGAESFDGTSSDVVEVVYAGMAHLPEDAEWSHALGGPWKPLCAVAGEIHDQGNVRGRSRLEVVPGE